MNKVCILFSYNHRIHKYSYRNSFLAPNSSNFFIQKMLKIFMQINVLSGKIYQPRL